VVCEVFVVGEVKRTLLCAPLAQHLEIVIYGFLLGVVDGGGVVAGPVDILLGIDSPLPIDFVLILIGPIGECHIGLKSNFAFHLHFGSLRPLIPAAKDFDVVFGPRGGKYKFFIPGWDGDGFYWFRFVLLVEGVDLGNGNVLCIELIETFGGAHKGSAELCDDGDGGFFDGGALLLVGFVVVGEVVYQRNWTFPFAVLYSMTAGAYEMRADGPGELTLIAHGFVEEIEELGA
jgi:hypothetical protein